MRGLLGSLTPLETMHMLPSNISNQPDPCDFCGLPMGLDDIREYVQDSSGDHCIVHGTCLKAALLANPTYTEA